MTMSDTEIGNAIIAGIADGDTVLEKMSGIVDHLRLAGFVIVPIDGGGAQRAPKLEIRDLIKELRDQAQDGREIIEPWQMDPNLFDKAATALETVIGAIIEECAVEIESVAGKGSVIASHVRALNTVDMLSSPSQ